MRITRVLVVLLVLISAASAFGQTTAALTGNVTSDGKPLPGVTVTVTAPTLQGSRETVTGENGGYQFSALPPGDYTIKFELSGMATVTKKAQVRLSQTGRADAALQVAAVSESMTVTASVPSVLETPQVSSTFTQKQIEALPVPRTPRSAALLSPGVNGNTLSANQFSISGSPGYDNLVMVNGVVVTENVRSQVQNLFVEDAVQETTVLTGAISAEYGRFTGGVVNSITKSGGNEYSGSLRDTISNLAWTSRTPFVSFAGTPQANAPNHLDNVYEETLGGYVLKDRLWFFGAGRQATTSILSSSVGVTNTSVPARNVSPFTFNDTSDQKRLEAKLTGMITSKQTLVGSYLRIRETETNNFFPPIYDTASLVNRELPNSLYSAHYSNVLTSNLLLEAQYSRRTFAFINSGSLYTDLARGTLLLDRSNGNTRFNSPTFCGVCAPETRDNGEYLVKGSYYLNTKSLGNHNFIGGVDNFKEKRFAENHQSGSDFRVFATTAWFDPAGVVYPSFDKGSFIRWTPILVKGANDNIKTQSAFINDKWDFNSHWSFNLGVRYDKNDAIDADGTVASKDSIISPRLTAIYDLHGDGRHRFTGSYNKYSSRIVEGIATSNQSAGSPGAIDYIYGGPSINPSTTPFGTAPGDAVNQLFAWLNSQCDANGKCGVYNLSLLRPGGARNEPGYVAVFPSRLTSPNVDEWTFGYGEQIGATGFVKVDLISRHWHDFYATQVTQNGPQATTAILHIPVDLGIVENSNEIKRSYNALQFQGQWHPRNWNMGVNYTYSKLRGNDEGETAGSGPVTNLPLSVYYPEYAGYAQRLPVGYLSADQRHLLRSWAGYDFHLGGAGTLNASVLESFDSGRPYATAFTADLLNYAGAPKLAGYIGGGPANGTYYVGGRDANRFQNSTHTDLALNYLLPISRFQLFVEGRMTNLFNEHHVTGSATGGGIDTSVISAVNTSNLAAFNPFTTAPVACAPTSALGDCKLQGANYRVSSTFGKPTSFTAFQPARSYYFSLGARF